MADNNQEITSLEELARQRDEARQQAESEAAQKLLQEMNAQDESDDAKKQAHEDSEAQRRAKWEAEKKARDEEIQFAWEEAVCVSDEQLMANSVKRLGDMTERLTRRNMKICVTESIQTLCYEDLGFARLVMHPRKSMVNCFKYINRKALDYLKQEMKDNGEKTTGVSAIGGDVPDELCYQWAEEYFRDLNAPATPPLPPTGMPLQQMEEPMPLESSTQMKFSTPRPAPNRSSAIAGMVTAL